MAVWEILRDAFAEAEAEGAHWLTGGEAISRVKAAQQGTNPGSIRAEITTRCINDPSKKHYYNIYRRNPLFITDDPKMRGKRYRLLSEEERAVFLADPQDDLEFRSYTQVADWLAGAGELPALTDGSEESDDPGVADEGFDGLALLEIHLQDYLHRHWSEVFPGLTLHGGDAGREFVTRDPAVGVLDFLARDEAGDYVVIETKRDTPDRQAVGQVLSYMGWVQNRLCADSESVRGILIAGDVSDKLRMAVAAVPNLEVRAYEVSFRLLAADAAAA